MIKWDWEVNGDTAKYHLSEDSHTYHATEDYANPGRVEHLLDGITDGQNISRMMKLRARNWSLKVEKTADEMIDEEVEQVVFDHGDTYRVMEDPTAQAVARETYKHLSETMNIDMNHHFSSEAYTRSFRHSLDYQN
jgi:hypothetical protein